MTCICWLDASIYYLKSPEHGLGIRPNMGTNLNYPYTSLNNCVIEHKP